MWQVLQQRHKEKDKDGNPQAYHLMMMGGDQVYADSIWEAVPPLKTWFDLSIKKRVQAPFTAEMRKLVEQFYFDLYCDRWSQGAAATVMSQIPSLMMWDDHDIFDGWGSYPPEQQASPVFQGIWKQARDHFRLFQLQAKDDADLGEAMLLGKRSFTYAHRIGDLAIVALDMRSERSQDHVMSLETWDRIQEWMYTELPEMRDEGKVIIRNRCQHLLVMSSIPVVYVNSNMLEATFGWIPGQQDLEDDFKDQWISRTHQGERLRLIHRLLKFSKDTGCRSTIVSGDVHVAGVGYIQSERDSALHDEANVVNQLISSAMVHPPPQGMIVAMMERVLGGQVEEVDRGITAHMSKFPGSAQRFIGARNWLSLEFDDKSRIWAHWFAEGQEKPYTKVIHPVGALTS
jgi:phosphodiesterase/alkaline phosphatase D-like protein